MTDTKSLIPLRRVVNAAIIDMYEDVGKVKETYSHWGARELKLLDKQILKKGQRQPVLLYVNPNTRTATLPPDFEEELFIGVINDLGIKIPLKLNNSIINAKYVDEVPCEDKCPKCNANKAICKDLEITEIINTVIVNSTNYDHSTIKKLYPNGDYFLEITAPYFDIDTNTVVFKNTKEFVAHIDLKDCGCVAETATNLNTIKYCNPDVYYCYYAGCQTTCSNNFGGYKIFEETGLIQFDYNFKFNQVYMEYKGFMPKINGQYYVPSVAFECLVEGIKFRSIKNKNNVSRFDTREYERYYVNAKNDMTKVLSRKGLSIASILNTMLTIPKFDITIDPYVPCNTIVQREIENTLPDDCENAGVISSSTDSNTNKMYIPYSFGVIAGTTGAPAGGSSIWQPPFLKDALNLTIIFLNDTVLTLAKGDFTFNNTIPQVDISPNKFFDGDVVVGEYFKYV